MSYWNILSNIYAVSGTNDAGKSTIVNLIKDMYIDEKQEDIKFIIKRRKY